MMWQQEIKAITLKYNVACVWFILNKDGGLNVTKKTEWFQNFLLLKSSLQSNCTHDVKHSRYLFISRL